MLPPLNIEDGLSQFRQGKKKIAALEADYQHALSNQQEFHVLKDILNQIKSLRESTPLAETGFLLCYSTAEIVLSPNTSNKNITV